MTIAKVRRVGNSLVVTIPREKVEALGLAEGDHVILDIHKAAVRPVLSPRLQKMAEKSFKRNEAGYRYLAEH